MKRLTTNCPDNNLDAALNLFYIKDFEVWAEVMGPGPARHPALADLSAKPQRFCCWTWTSQWMMMGVDYADG